MQESYDKRMNTLIHGIKEDDDNVWEKRERTREKFQDFFVNGLKINDPEDVEFVDLHRLPQHPVKVGGKSVHRPIIVKLLIINDKNLIFKNARNLRDYNNARIISDNHSPYVFMTEHLPKRFQLQRKFLTKAYKEAREKNQKTVWKAVDGNYALFVDGRKIPCPLDI